MKHVVAQVGALALAVLLTGCARSHTRAVERTFAPGCEPQDVAPICEAIGACDLAPEFYWNGERCTELGCPSERTCQGEDCDALYYRYTDCVTAYRNCVVTGCENGACGMSARELCVGTGGSYDYGACGDARCGEPSLLACATGGCNCGPTKGFVEDRGCVTDPWCPGVQCF